MLTAVLVHISNLDSVVLLWSRHENYITMFPSAVFIHSLVFDHICSLLQMILIMYNFAISPVMRQGIRVFSSGAIAKRHDATTLETADGITITIVGFLNKSRTHQNGFPSEEYAVQCFVGESTKSGVSKKPSGCEEFNSPSTNSANNLLPASLDDLPVTRPTTVDTELDRTPRNDKKAEVEKFEDDNSILDVSDMRTEE
ncbi:Protein embryo defective 1674 [Vitis vinifera]|uniref:Protein embryo defective 1674 n=1 Tax=Vitis vinifera TaxID=29760 RepID=A0A438FIY8_VITVI|nr:Protein embryo defective 1674 [Vitis vinifera]